MKALRRWLHRSYSQPVKPFEFTPATVLKVDATIAELDQQMSAYRYIPGLKLRDRASLCYETWSIYCHPLEIPEAYRCLPHYLVRHSLEPVWFGKDREPAAAAAQDLGFRLEPSLADEWLLAVSAQRESDGLVWTRPKAYGMQGNTHPEWERDPFTWAFRNVDPKTWPNIRRLIMPVTNYPNLYYANAYETVSVAQATITHFTASEMEALFR